MSEQIKKEVSKEVSKEVKEVKEVKRKLNVVIPKQDINKFNEYYKREKPRLKHKEYTIYNIYDIIIS